MLKEEFIKTMKNKGLNELEQEYAILDAKIKELKEQREYIQNIIKDRVDIDAIQIANNELQTKDKIILLIHRGLTNKEISNFLPETAESYIRQVRSDYLGQGVKKQLYKNALAMNGFEKQLQLVALDVYYDKSYTDIMKNEEKYNLNISNVVIDICMLVNKHYKTPALLSLPNDQNTITQLSFITSLSIIDIKNYLIKYYNALDAHIAKNVGTQLKKSNDNIIPELVQSLMFYVGKASQLDLKKMKLKLQNQYGLSDSYINRVVYVLQSVYEGRYKISSTHHVSDLLTKIKDKTKLPDATIKMIILQSGLIEPQYLNMLSL